MANTTWSSSSATRWARPRPVESPSAWAKRTDASRIVIQTKFQYQTGQLVNSKPKAYELPEKPGRIYPTGTPLDLILKAAARESIALLGPLVDRDKDCRLDKDEQGRSMKIEIPGDKLHTLAPELVTEANKKKPLHNAPMTLAPIQGDFAACVQVTGEISPSLTLPEDRQGNDIASTFQGAGLLLYRDKDNFIRFRKNSRCGCRLDPAEPQGPVPGRERRKAGRQSDVPLAPQAPACLFMLRRNGRLICGVAPDLATPPIQIKEIALDLPPQLKIGLSASNVSTTPFTASFENFALLSDVSPVQAKFRIQPR